jgi:hypothetical protein
MNKLLTELLALLLTGLLGFFSAGAVYLPIMGDYLGRVIFTLGGMSLLYGFEAVVRFGHVKACTFGFSVADCKEHNLLVPSLVLWFCFYALWRLHVWNKAPQDKTEGKPPEISSQPSKTLAKPSEALAKPSYAAVAVVSALLFSAWVLLSQTVISPTLFGSFIYPLRLALTLGFGLMLYKAAKAHMVGTTQQLVLQLVLSAAVGFFGTGLVYQLLVWAPPLDSPIDALFSLITETMTAGFKSVFYLGNTATALIPAFLLWTASFAWLIGHKNRNRTV